MNASRKKVFILLVLAFLFMIPGLSAYVLYTHPTWLSADKLNKGLLLNPPQKLAALDTQKKWRILYWSPKACAKKCVHTLETLARVRLALGRRLYDVDQWLILDENAPALTEEYKALLHEWDFKFAHNTRRINQKPKIFIADPNNYLILEYSASANPQDVFKDLQLLLKTQNASV